MAVAAYMRLSLADGDLGKDNKDESNSIEGQRMMLHDFIAMRDDLCGEVREYVDDGYTGTNFDRPGFRRMLEDAKRGEVQAIVVKDLSRLGRDYISVGDYLEQIFPAMGIRFIAVYSGYDSADYEGSTMGLDMSITNLVNSLYSKDLSKKYTSAIETKWRQGVPTAGRLPYGYRKDEADKKRWLIDPEAAKCVRLIFDKALDGWGTRVIANYLNENHYPTPGQYKSMHGEMDGLWYRKVSDKEWMWEGSTVLRILQNYTYTGALVQGKARTVRVGSRQRRTTQRKDQFITEGAHEAIVTHEEFEDAQLAIRNSSRKMAGQKYDYPLRGKVRCGNCRLTLAYQYNTEPILYCAHKASAGKRSSCCAVRYKEKRLEGIVGHALYQKLEEMVQLGIRLREKAGHAPGQAQDGRKELARKMDSLKAEKIRQYEAYAEGIISREEYLGKKQEIAEGLRQCQGQMERQEAVYGAQEDTMDALADFSAKMEGFLPPGPLTAEAADAFIDVVYVYDPDHIEVVFKFEDLFQKAVGMADGMENGH